MTWALPACGPQAEPKKREPTKARELSIELTERSRGRARLRVPPSVPAGLVRIRFQNSGRRAHDAQLIRIDGPHRLPEALKTIDRLTEGGPLPSWLHMAGGVGRTEPGASRSSTQQLSEGTYYVVDSEAPGPFAKAPTAPLRVTRGKGGAELPRADASITATEYTFTTSGLKAGKNRVVFENAGTQIHHAVITPLKPKKTVADVRKFASGEIGASPIDDDRTQTTTVLDPGTRQITELQLRPGRYALLCFTTDRAGGPPHLFKGMLVEATVRRETRLREGGPTNKPSPRR